MTVICLWVASIWLSRLHRNGELVCDNKNVSTPAGNLWHHGGVGSYCADVNPSRCIVLPWLCPRRLPRLKVLLYLAHLTPRVVMQQIGLTWNLLIAGVQHTVLNWRLLFLSELWAPVCRASTAPTCSSDVTDRCCQTSTSKMLSQCNHVFGQWAFLRAHINISRLTYLEFLSWIGPLIISVPIKAPRTGFMSSLSPRTHQHFESAACYKMLTTIQCRINVHCII